MNPTSIKHSYHVTLVNLRTHGQLDDKPGGVPQDEGGDEVPVDDVSQAADAPVRQAEGHKDRMTQDFSLRIKLTCDQPGGKYLKTSALLGVLVYFKTFNSRFRQTTR